MGTLPTIATLRQPGSATWLCRLSAAFALVCLAGLVPARADVLEIGPDGSVVVNSGPALYRTADLRPEPLVPHRSERSTAASVADVHAVARISPDIHEAISSASARFGVSPALVTAVAWRESRFNGAALSHKGARGVMQLMPATVRRFCGMRCTPRENVVAGVAYLGQLLKQYNGDIVEALAAYNAGPRAVEKFGGMPPYRETHDYVDAILARMSSMALAEPD